MIVDEAKPMDQIPNRAAALVGDTYRLHWGSMKFAEEMKKATNELPDGFGQIFCDEVCYQLMRMGTVLLCPERRLLDLIPEMAKSEAISWITVLNTFARFNSFERPKCVEAICDILVECLPLISCEPREACDCKQLSEATERLLEWFLHGAQVSPRTSISSLTPITECFRCYSENRFIQIVIYLRSQLDTDLFQRWQSEVERFLGVNAFTEPISQCYSSILENVRQLANPPTIDIPLVTKNYLRDARPTIATLITVYSDIGMYTDINEICDACLILGDTFGIESRDLVRDIVRTGLLVNVHPDDFREREGQNVMFIMQVVPLVLEELFLRQRITREDIVAAVLEISNQRTLLDSCDQRYKSPFYSCFVGQIAEHCGRIGIGMENFQHAVDKRFLITKREHIERHESGSLTTPYRVFVAAKKAKRSLDKHDFSSNIWPKMVSLLIRGQGMNFDSICAWSSLDNSIPSVYAKLIWLNSIWQNCKQFEARRPHEVDLDYFQLFDATFLLLSRLRISYLDLQVDDLPSGDTMGTESTAVFYKWDREVNKHLEEGKPMKLADESRKIAFQAQYNDLKNGKPYWDQSWTGVQLFETLPVVAEMILDDIRAKQITAPGQSNVEPLLQPVGQILTALSPLPSLIVGLLQWVSTQKCDADRQHQDHSVLPELASWIEMSLVVRPLLRELLGEANPAEMPYPWIVQCARRALPCIRGHAAPDMQALKDAYLYACRQNWASPNVIALVDKCDRVNPVWSKVWFLQMLKALTLDELTSYSEICISAAFCAPIHFFIALQRHIVDHVLNPEHAVSATSQPLSIVLAQMLVRLMILSVWANKQTFRARQKKVIKAAAARHSFEHMETEEGAEEQPEEQMGEPVENEENPPEAQLMNFGPDGPVLKTIELTLNRFFKETMTGHLKPTTSFIIRFIIELALAKRSSGTTPEHWADVVAMLPMDLLFSLGRIDPYSMSIDVFLTLYSDLSDVETNLNCLKFACVHRKMRVL
ncbi:hypothetical protein QR680_012580 [Steinernema hermaphroditum]|uniref:Mediator of RNA polymerase II transcription subunit 24 n=1 Tax=Steinernema hermaphroditum TaxID=289476 RepID=A0AA39M0R0_9BILA|nr:hypothetical protein QR680_012580 [Steinernema hermaphroditum]